MTDPIHEVTYGACGKPAGDQCRRAHGCGCLTHPEQHDVYRSVQPSPLPAETKVGELVSEARNFIRETAAEDAVIAAAEAWSLTYAKLGDGDTQVAERRHAQSSDQLWEAVCDLLEARP